MECYSCDGISRRLELDICTGCDFERKHLSTNARLNLDIKYLPLPTSAILYSRVAAREGSKLQNAIILLSFFLVTFLDLCFLAGRQQRLTHCKKGMEWPSHIRLHDSVPSLQMPVPQAALWQMCQWRLTAHLVERT